MSALFAHHLELYHLPVLLAFLAAGFWIGWQLGGRLGRRQGTEKQERKG